MSRSSASRVMCPRATAMPAVPFERRLLLKDVTSRRGNDGGESFGVIPSVWVFSVLGSQEPRATALFNAAHDVQRS